MRASLISGNVSPVSERADEPVPAGIQRVGVPGRARRVQADLDRASGVASRRDDWTGVVLAGGASRRFGGIDKTRLPLGGRTLLTRAVDSLQAVCGQCLVVGGTTPVTVPRVVDGMPGSGPLGGIVTALESLSTPHALVLAADLPFMSVDLLRALQHAGEGVDVCWLAGSDGRRPLCVAVTRRLAPAVRALWSTGARRVRDLDEAGTSAVVDVPAAANHGALWNVNDPLTYARALEMAEHCPAC